jgi:hypothetical protein
VTERIFDEFPCIFPASREFPIQRRVRSRLLPPAASLRTIGSSAAKEPYNGLLDHLPTKQVAARLREIMQAHPQAGSRKPLVHVVRTQVVTKTILSAALAKSRRVGRRELAHGSTAIGLDKIAAAPG